MFPTVHGIAAQAGENVASYTVTTTGAQTHTIELFGVSASTLIDWGDGNQNTYTGTLQRTHNYAGVGVWTVKIFTPENVTAFLMADSKVTVNSKNLPFINITQIDLRQLAAGSIVNTADMATWTAVTRWKLVSMPAGTYTVNSVHMSAWPMDNFQFSGMPAGTYTINSENFSTWNPSFFQIFDLPSGSISNITASGFANFKKCSLFRLSNSSLLQAQINTTLWSLYQASISPRTATNGTINIGGNNSTPSGTFQAAAACPVTVATPGKEVAYELLNDSCGAFTNHWATVTITA